MLLRTLTDIGIKRNENQDNYWSAVLDVNGKQAGVICLCDGMGGLEKGYLASKMVTEAVKEHILTTFDFDKIGSVLSKVNNDIRNLTRAESLKSMGTTCTILICYEGIYRVCHIGDSRAYKLSKDNIVQITEDHSAVKKYGITKENNLPLYNKYKNKLTKCIGVEDIIKPEMYKGTYSYGDVFFLCSDGCWHYFDDRKLTLDSIGDLKVLFENCKMAGETDNITAGVLYIDF